MAAGCPPQAARKWWLGEMARRANDSGTDIADLGVTPLDVARVQALVDEGSLNDKLARQVFEITWYPAAIENLVGIIVTAVVVAAVGVVSNLDVLRRKPLAILRAE